MSLSQFEQVFRHRRSVRSREAEAWQHRGKIEPTVKTVAEFGQAARQMLGTDLVIGTVKCVFNVAEDGIVSSQRKSSNSMLAAPPPVTTGWCSTPASATRPKQPKPSLTRML